MNKKPLVTAVALFAVVVSLGSKPAYAQWYTAPNVVAYGTGAAAYGGYYGGYGAQTPGGANATGLGNLVRSAGAYNEATARAEIEYQAARSVYIDNQHKIHEERLFRKREHQALVTQDRENARASRERQQEFEAAHRPQPLATEQLDPGTGHIHWPVALQTPEFEELRSATQTLFETKSKYGATSEISAQIVRKTGELKDMLRGMILTIPLSEYTEARRFLESMIVSAR